jgi:hypothetical protein
MISRRRLFNAISVGLLPAESSQFSKIFDSNPMLHLQLFDGYYNARGAAIGVFAPSVATENAQRLSQCLIETLRRDLVGMLDALRVLACHPACSDSHHPFRIGVFVFYSLE